MDSRSGESFHGNRGSRDKRVNIETFYLTSETNIWWNTMKNRLLGFGFTWSKFMEELTTTNLSAEWELTSVCGAVAQSTSLLPVPKD